jgi:ribosome-associated protein
MQNKPSKSALKRQQHALQALGESLIELPEDQLRSIPLDEDLFDAIVTASQMKSHGALRRQRQLIGKLMRNVDAAPIREALDAATQSDRRSKAVFHQAEQWRDRIMASGREALLHFPADNPEAVAELETLIDALDRCGNSDQRRRLGRQVFRAVHATLAKGA